MAMHFVLAFTALVHKRELEKSPNIGALAGKGNEYRDIGRIVFGIFAIGVEVDGPLVTTDGEALAGYVFANAHAFGQGVSLDDEFVGPIHGLGHRLGARWGAWRRHRRILSILPRK